MKHLRKLILLGLIISFYFIQISYNGTPSDALGSGLINAFKTGFLVGIYIIYTIINVFFVLWFIKLEKYYSVLFVIFPVIVWFFWAIKFDGIIDTNLYFKSSVSYLSLTFSAIILSFLGNKNSLQ